MSDINQEQQRLIDHFFSQPHIRALRIAETDANLGKMSAFIRDYLSNRISLQGLEWMVKQLAPQLEFLAGADLTQQIAEARQLAENLAADKKLLEERAAVEQRRKESIARLDSQGVRGNHGFATADDIEKENARIQRETKARQVEAAKQVLYQQFLKELADANQFLVTNFNGIKWGATNEARARMKAALRVKFKEFANEVRD
jgi:hypothetical protein